MISSNNILAYNGPNSQVNNVNYLNKYIFICLQYVSRSRVQVLDLLADMFFRYKKLYMSQSFLGRRFGLRRETVNRALQELSFFALVKIIPQEHKKMGYTCGYILSNIFTKEICKKFSKFFKSFRFFNVKYLCSNWLPIDIKKNVTLVNSLNYNIYLTTPVSLVPCKYKVTYSKKKNEEQGKKITSKKEEDMKQEESVLMTAAIQDADYTLGLTIHGKAKLRAFDDQAVRYALTQLDKAQGINNKFEFMITKAMSFSSEKRLTINWKRYYNLLEAYGIDKGDKEFLIKKEEPARKEKSTYKTKSEVSSHPRSSEETNCGELSRRKDEQWAQTKLTADLKRTLAEQNSLHEIETWRKWTKTDNYKECKRKLGWSDAQLVAPSVVEVIKNKKVDEDIIEMLFMEYPFLEERCRSNEANPIKDLIDRVIESPRDPSFKEDISEKYSPKQYASDYITKSCPLVEEFPDSTKIDSSTDEFGNDNTEEEAENFNTNLLFD